MRTKRNLRTSISLNSGLQHLNLTTVAVSHYNIQAKQDTNKIWTNLFVQQLLLTKMGTNWVWDPVSIFVCLFSSFNLCTLMGILSNKQGCTDRHSCTSQSTQAVLWALYAVTHSNFSCTGCRKFKAFSKVVVFLSWSNIWDKSKCYSEQGNRIESLVPVQNTETSEATFCLTFWSMCRSWQSEKFPPKFANG